jgi:hypothetical protein
MSLLKVNFEGWTRERRGFFIVFDLSLDFGWGELRILVLNQEIVFGWRELWYSVRRIFKKCEN